MSSYTEKHREYYLKNKEAICEKQRIAGKEWVTSPKGQYSVQKRHSKQRDISWELTFDQWWTIWQESGHWEERGPGGYAMCRAGDVGPYSELNVRIDTWRNNAIENYQVRGIDERGRIKGKSST